MRICTPVPKPCNGTRAIANNCASCFAAPRQQQRKQERNGAHDFGRSPIFFFQFMVVERREGRCFR